MSAGYLSYDTPLNNVDPRLRCNEFCASFSNGAIFMPVRDSTGTRGGYRQLVKGSFKAGGSILTHYLCPSRSIVLRQNALQEDEYLSLGHSTFGDQSCRKNLCHKFLSGPKNGNYFHMKDAPGFRNIQENTKYIIDLEFKGYLVDTSTNKTLITRKWTVKGSTTVTEAKLSKVSVGLEIDDKIMDSRIIRNTVSGSKEVHIIISRLHGRPPLDIKDIEVSFRDTQSKTISPVLPPAVYEVGNLVYSTVSIIYTFPADVDPKSLTYKSKSRAGEMSIKTPLCDL